MSLTNQAEEMVKLALDPQATAMQLRPLAKAFFDGLAQSTKEDALRGLEILGRGIASPSDDAAAFIAMVCGALIEQGAPANMIMGPLMYRVNQAAAQAKLYFDACIAELSDAEKGDLDRFDTVTKELATSMPDLHSGWKMLEKLFPPTIAALSTDAAIRRNAKPLLSNFSPLAGHHTGARWIARMLSVLDDEPFVVLEPATGLGIVGKMSGISENFQLNVLLMDQFPGTVKPRVSAEAAATARGDGPPQGKATLVGQWNLSAWTALRSDGTLPDPKDLSAKSHWIWNEGIPADIPTFEGYRVILLSPPPYSRAWGSQREFVRLKAALVIEQVLDAEQVVQWIRRLTRAG